MAIKRSSRLGKVALSAVTVALLAAAGCSSTARSEDGSNSGDAASSGQVSGIVADAQASVDEAVEAPAKIGVTEPLKSSPAQGGSIVYLKPDAAGGELPIPGLEEATKAIGWGFRTINFKLAEPATLVAGMQEALGYKPTAVVIPSSPIQVWQNQIPAYEQAGVKIVPLFLGQIEQNETVLGNLQGPADVAAAAKVVADYVIANSDGQGKALVVSAPDVPAEAAFADTVHKRLDECSDCSYTDLELTTPQLADGSGTRAVVSALQKDPSIGYIMNAYGPQLPGLPGALAAAGLSNKVKTVGYYGGPADFAAVKAGQVDAYTSVPFTYSAYQVVDIVLRDQQGIPFEPNDGGVPVQLFVEGTDFDVDAATNYDQPADALDQFKALWKVSD